VHDKPDKLLGVGFALWRRADEIIDPNTCAKASRGVLNEVVRGGSQGEVGSVERRTVRGVEELPLGGLEDVEIPWHAAHPLAQILDGADVRRVRNVGGLKSARVSVKGASSVAFDAAS